MAFQKYRHSNIKGEKGSNWNIEIWKDGFTGTSTEFEMQGEGFEITWNGSGGTRVNNVLASSCTINMFIQNESDEDFTESTLTGGFQTYFIRIYKGVVSDANIWWYGWVQPSFDIVENAPFPYIYKLMATDSIGYFNKKKPLLFTDETDKNASITIKSLFMTCLGKLSSGDEINVGGSTTGNLSPAPDDYKWLRTSSNWWREGDSSSYGTVDPLSLYYISQGAFADETKIDDEGNIEPGGNPLEYKQQDAFNGALKLFNLRVFLAEGRYNFIQPNLLATNSNGALLTYSYNAEGQGVVSENITTSITIDQSIGDNVILSGSNFIYEPPLESATIEYTQGISTFDISPETNIEGTGITVGYTNQNTGIHTLKFVVRNYINVLKSDFNFSSNKDVFNNTYRNSCDLTIKLSNGSDDYYLQEVSGTNQLVWTLSNSTPLILEVRRGYFISYNDPINNQTLMDIVGGASNDSSWNSADYLPCKRTQWTSWNGAYVYHYKFDTLIRFTAEVASPPISGEITIATTTSNDYYQRTIGSAGSVLPINTPTPENNKTEVLEISYIPVTENDIESVSGNILFKASQTDTKAWETQSLGSTRIGQRLNEEATFSDSADKLYSVQHLDNGMIKPAIEGFREGNTDDYKPILQLIVNEYLDLQTQPLEILQAKIQSANISPLKLIKYSVNQDGANFKNYAFLGGTFSAQSEIMNGEWYKVRDYSVGIIEDTPAMSGIFSLNSDINNSNNIKQDLKSIHKNNYNSFLDNSLATIDTSIVTTSPTTSISVGSSLKSELAENQKVKLTYPDGSNSTTITVSDGYNDSATSINVNSFTSDIDYPIGSIISVAPYEITSLIQRFSSGGTVNSRSVGVNVIQEINFTPQDFNLASANGGHITTLDSGASVQISNDTKFMYAMKLVNKGKTLTKVMVFGSANYSYRVFEGFIFNNTTNLVGSGQANTELDITDIVGTSRNYIIIQIDVAATSEKVYGGYALVTNS